MSASTRMMNSSVARDAAVSRSMAESTEAVVTELRWQVNKLTLANMALFELLQARLGITEDEMLAKMTEIDLRDGKLDGHAPAPQPIVCEVCGRPYSKRHNHCLYCGHVNMHGTAF